MCLQRVTKSLSLVTDVTGTIAKLWVVKRQKPRTWILAVCSFLFHGSHPGKLIAPIAWLVMVAISNAQSKFHSFNDLMTQVTVEEYLSSSDNIVNEVTKNFHEPKDPSKFLEIFLTVGAELAGAATLRGPLAILPMVLNVWGAVGLDQPEFEQPWKKEDVKGSVRAAIGGSLKEYSKFARQSFSHVVMNGNAPRISKNKETTWSKKIEAGTGSALADYLGDKSLWAVETGGEESKKALAWVIVSNAY